MDVYMDLSKLCAKDEKFTEAANAALLERLERIRSWLIEKAVEIGEATSSEKQPFSAMCIAEAARLLPLGQELKSTENGRPPGFWGRMLESISGITLISAALALAFGILGYLTKSNSAAGWLDIAKVFAGAIVGSAGVATSAAIRGRPGK